METVDKTPKHYFTVTKITSSEISVEFPDGSHANVPIQAGDTKLDITNRIGEYYHPAEKEFESAEMVPFLEGEVTELENVISTEPEEKNYDEGDKAFHYQDFREENYPSPKRQLYALHLARQGDYSELEIIDQEIKEVDELYPVDMPPMTSEQHMQYLESLSEL